MIMTRRSLSCHPPPLAGAVQPPAHEPVRICVTPDRDIAGYHRAVGEDIHRPRSRWHRVLSEGEDGTSTTVGVIRSR